MRLSESLRKNIMEVTVGRLLNKFKIKKRRNVLFFEDILANYIKECEDAGYGEEIEAIAQKWCALMVKQLAFETLRKLPLSLFFNVLAKKVWINLGLVKDMHTTMKDNIINIETKNEVISRVIGKNDFCVGLFKGIFNIFCACQSECIRKNQTVNECKYVFRLKKGHYKDVKSKSKPAFTNGGNVRTSW